MKKSRLFSKSLNEKEENIINNVEDTTRGPQTAVFRAGVPGRLTIKTWDHPTDLQKLAVREVEKTRYRMPNKKGVEPNKDVIKKIYDDNHRDRSTPEENERYKKDFPVTYKGSRIKRDLTDEMRDDLVEHFLRGGSYLSFAKAADMHPATLQSILRKFPEFKKELEEIRRGPGADALADEALRVATTPFIQEELIETYDKEGKLITKSIKKADNPYARKLAFQGITYLLGKIAPDRYGDNVKREENSSFAARIQEARDRIQKDIRSLKRHENDAPLDKNLPGLEKDEYK